MVTTFPQKLREARAYLNYTTGVSVRRRPPADEKPECIINGTEAAWRAVWPVDSKASRNHLRRNVT